jgi:predicted RNA-binding Zn-ribbon protein involved in translation (DUF1610 family)
MAKPESLSTPDGPRCISCGRVVRPAIKCVATFCPYAKSLNHAGVPVIARPVRQRWIV